MAAIPTFAARAIAVSATVIPAPEVSDTIGVPCLITTDPLDGASRYLLFSTTTAIDAAEDASEIGSGTAAALRLALGQDQRPTQIAVITYDPTPPANEAPSDGLQDAINEGLDVGVFQLASNTEATINTLATWLAADAARKARYLMVFQTSDSSAYGGSKPAALADCEQLGVRGFFSADTEYLATAYMGKLAGRRMVGSASAGPAGAQARILGVTPTTTLTESQLNNLATYGFGVLQPLDDGASATQRMIYGTLSYDGETDWSSAVSLVYAARQCRAAALGVWQAHGISGIPLKANALGIAEAEAAIQAVLQPMATAGHFTPTETAPLGYLIAGSVSGTVITVDVTLYLAGEATSFSVPIVGVEV